MKAILIDPANQTISEVETTGELHDIYRIMECNMVECPISFANGDTMYCNENFWLEVGDEEETRHFTGIMMANWSYPLMGKTLVIGNDVNTGDVKDVQTAVGFLQRTIRFVDPRRVIAWANANGLTA